MLHPVGGKPSLGVRAEIGEKRKSSGLVPGFPGGKSVGGAGREAAEEARTVPTALTNGKSCTTDTANHAV